MKKTLIISLIATTLMPLVASAQLRTPFEKVARDENGKRQYIYPNPQLGKSAISVSYGYAPVCSFNWWNSPIFDSKMMVGMNYNSETSSNIGVIGISYNNQLTPWLELQIPINFSYSTGTFTNIRPTEDPNYYESWVSLLPNVKISWAFNDLIHIYSRLGIGVGIGNRYEGYQAGMNAKAAFMWQFSPIGFEVGRRARFFIEAGYGQMGIVNGGLKIVFNKSGVKPDGTKREVKQWYERI